MRPLARGARAGIFAGILLWHALVVLLLMRPRTVVPPAPEAVMTWLRFDEPRPRVLTDPPLTAPSLQWARERAAAPPVAADVTPGAGTAITPPKTDWYREASRAAREQYADKLPTPASLEPKPGIAAPPSEPSDGHRRGDQEDIGNGPCPPTAGEVRVQKGRCVPKIPPNETAVLERRRPKYLEPPITIPRGRQIPNAPRPGPAMGGAPGR